MAADSPHIIMQGISEHFNGAVVFLLVPMRCDTAQALMFLLVSICRDTAPAKIGGQLELLAFGGLFVSLFRHEFVC